MRFSERIGKRKVKDVLQLEGIDQDLRIGLWNLIFLFIFEKCPDQISGPFHGMGGIQRVDNTKWEKLFSVIWALFFKKLVDEMPSHKGAILGVIKKWFLEAPWYEIYDFIEFIYDTSEQSKLFTRNIFESVCNDILQKEHSGYRLIKGVVSPITNQNEIQEIQDAINDNNLFGGVSNHIQSALEKLSDKHNPDYRNSIKESISAVESISKVLARNTTATLGDALKCLSEKIDLHGALEKGFLSIYGYTNDEKGIRHAMIEESTCDFDDAKYMLVSCSSFVNYLKAKASKAGLI